MIEININKLSKSYGINSILKKLDLQVNTNEIISIVGDNGSGKSTLLKLIAKEENPTSGNISIRKGSTIGLLNQIPESNNNKVINILKFSLKDIFDIEEKLINIQNKMNNCKEEELNNLIIKYSNLQEEFIRNEGYEISEKLGKIVNIFKLNQLLNTNFNDLSGGEKTIVSLAALIIKNPDILLLDEPTNHLDIETLEWLETYLKSYKGTVLIVSHDRYFLDKVSTKTVLIENGKEIIFHGNYSYYIEENEKRLLLEEKDYNDQQKEIKNMKESINRFKAWGKIAGNEMFYKRANSMQKRLDKMIKVNKPVQNKELPINFNMEDRSGKEVIKVTNLNISYDKNIFNKANMLVRFKEHVCLVGGNGTGKSTLIKAILNGNESILVGSNVKIGYIPQEIIFSNEKGTVYDIARKEYNGDEQHLRSSLNKFMFYKEDINKRINNLSGGEKVRLLLFCLIQKKVNLLILDEPTNHIDISTREILELALNDYNGTLFFTSHDRYFINNVATKIISIENNKLVEYPGNYDDYKFLVNNKK